jgi:adenosylcobinamide-GDP ribazoletransferase
VWALLSFFTALPVRNVSLWEVAKSAYLLPFVGLVTGVPGAALILLGYAVPPGVISTLALAAVLLAAGLHHADGLLDVGDALMVRGTPERRRAILKDTRVGVGGIGALFMVYAPTLAALIALANDSPTRATLALLAGEVSVRSAMVFMLSFGKPAEANSSTVPFVRALKGARRLISVPLALLAPLPFLLPLDAFAPLAAFSAPLAALGALQLARRAFGGINGDLVGATGELTRAAFLVFLSAIV